MRLLIAAILNRDPNKFNPYRINQEDDKSFILLLAIRTYSTYDKHCLIYKKSIPKHNFLWKLFTISPNLLSLNGSENQYPTIPSLFRKKPSF
ncbi:hypothetical protein LEP1GSC086_4146 [Leptospira weilii str. LNT 1234]|nr:hypothetical protein LEP1GSC086_4146 [Leptospira weilii str. LNT 1234]QDK23808.1 hypothetical protein FHG67_14575 [Leptospira weilii]QDK26555.1 hypothetical protein FHG68_07685 [Leptospira weilii]